MPNKLDKVKDLLKLLQNDTITPSQLKGFIIAITTVVKEAKDNLNNVSQETKDTLQNALSYLEEEHSRLLSKNEERLSKTEKKALETLNKAEEALKAIKSIEIRDGIDGKDADEEKIIDEVLSKIEIPISEIETPKKIKEKLESLKGDKRLDISAIKGGEKLTTNDQLDNAISILDQRSSFLINKTVKHDSTLSGSGTDSDPLSVIGGGGGTWGSITGTLSSQTDLQNALNAKADVTNILQNITANSFITDGGTSSQFVKGDGTLDGSTYLTGNQSITLSGDITGTGTTAITTTIASGAVDIAMLSATGTPSSSTYLRGDNTWATIAGGGDMVLASAQTNSGIKTFLDTTMKLRNVANTFDAYFTNTVTADRVITIPDRALTLDNITTSTTTTGTGFLKGNGSVISFDNSTYLTSVGTGVANELTYWSGTNTLGSLATATYPSITEISYVKGVTSGIQTQLGGKQATLVSGTNIKTINSTSLLGSGDITVGDMTLTGIQSVTGLKTFDTTKLAVKGSSTGTTAIASANASATSYTATLQAGNGTLAYLTDIPSLTGYVTTNQTVGQTIGDTTNRLTKLWATDITATNAITGSITGNAGTVSNATLTTALTVNTGAVTLTGNVAGSTLTLGAGASSVSGSNTGDQTTISGNAGSATILETPRTIWGQNFNGSANVTGDITLGASNITMTGSIASTLSRVTKGWFTDLEVTNAIVGSITGSAPTLTTARAIYGNNFDGSAALTQVIASNYGGTGNGFTKFTGPTTTEKTYTLPDANATLLYSGGTLGTPSSGTLTNATGLPLTGLVDDTTTALGVGTIELGHASDTTISRVSAGVIAVEGVTIPTISSTNTFTNKRITPRVSSETSSATPTINTDNVDAHSITALAIDITSMTTNLSGTPTNFQKLVIRFKDNGTARAITWGASFEDAGKALPTTTVISKLLTVGFIYNTVTSKWGCVAVANET